LKMLMGHFLLLIQYLLFIQHIIDGEIKNGL